MKVASYTLSVGSFIGNISVTTSFILRFLAAKSYFCPYLEKELHLKSLAEVRDVAY